MDNDSTTYVDPQGWATKDYTMDPSDVARMGLVSSGTTRSGLPIVNTDNDAWTRQYLGGAPDATDVANWAAVGMAPGGVAPLAPPSNYVTSQPRSTGSNVASAGIPNFLSQSSAGTPPPPPGMWPMVQQASVDRDNSAAMAAIPQDYSTPQATAKTRSALASFIPGGSNLYSSLVASGTIDNTTTPNANLLSGLTDSDGKPLPGNQLNTKLLSDPRFQQLRKMDQINGTNNADRFYSAMNNGRSLSTDLQANQALLSTQGTNKLKDANDLQKELAIAPKDDPTLGIHAGDFVRQKVVNGIMPGTDSVTHVPLTDYDRELAGLVPDSSGATDQYGRPVYNPNGNSFLKQATGLPAATDLAYGHQLLARRNASNKTQNATAVAAMPPATPTFMDKLSAIGSNATNTVGDLITNPLSFLDNTRNPNGYTTPDAVAANRVRDAVTAAAAAKQAKLANIGMAPDKSGPFDTVLDTDSGYSYQ